jgi:hypothetical protein
MSFIRWADMPLSREQNDQNLFVAPPYCQAVGVGNLYVFQLLKNSKHDATKNIGIASK